MSKRRKFSDEFKREAVGLTRHPGANISQIARDIGVGGISAATAQPDQILTRTVERLLKLLEAHDWKVSRRVDQIRLPERVCANLISRTFASSFFECESKSQRVCFHGARDYGDDSENGWRFVERDLMLEPAQGDEEWTARIHQFWRVYVPLALSVTGDYTCLACNATGQIIESYAPDFEAIGQVAESLEDFVLRLESAAVNDPDDLLFRTWVLDD